jgi:predicted GIY-YIG superfamily endonuclease
MPHEYRFHVYRVQSSSREALYIGMTNNFRKRVFQRKTHALKASPSTTTPAASYIGNCLDDGETPSIAKSN